jgi:hypothetical protein
MTTTNPTRTTVTETQRLDDGTTETRGLRAFVAELHEQGFFGADTKAALLCAI